MPFYNLSLAPLSTWSLLIAARICLLMIIMLFRDSCDPFVLLVSNDIVELAPNADSGMLS